MLAFLIALGKPLNVTGKFSPLLLVSDRAYLPYIFNFQILILQPMPLEKQW